MYYTVCIMQKVFGVKGPSWLCTVPGFDMIAGMSTDYMHCVLLGVCRQLLRLWLQSCHHKEPWYIGTKVVSIDERLCNIKPPNEIQRTPRKLGETMKFWKGIPIAGCNVIPRPPPITVY